MSVTGAWRIVEMDFRDAEAIDLLGPGYIQFDADRTGHFRFIAVEGWMDCQSGRRDGRPYVEFTWEGNDESDPASGRGWAALEEDGSLRGHIYFHLGDDSGLRAVRAEGLAPAAGGEHLGTVACRRASAAGGGASRPDGRRAGEVQDRGLAAVSGSGDRPIWFRLVMRSSPVDAA